MSFVNRCMTISGVSCVLYMKMTASLTSLSAVGMEMTGKSMLLFQLNNEAIID